MVSSPREAEGFHRYNSCENMLYKRGTLIFNLFFLMSMEGEEYHRNQLVKYCRVCGKAVKDYAHSVNKGHRNLLAVAGIDTSQVSKEVPPNSFCNGCYLTLWQIQAADLSGNV